MVLSQNKVLGVLCMKKANCDVLFIREIIRLLDREKLEWYRVVI